MVKLRQELRFALESRQAFAVLGERRRQHLDRDFTLELGVRRAEHFSHSALPERSQDSVRPESGADRQTHASSTSRGAGDATTAYEPESVFDINSM